MMVKKFYIPAKNIKKKTILHFSDLHVAVYDEFSSGIDKKFSILANEHWMERRKFLAEKYNEPYGENEMCDIVKHGEDLFKLASQADAAVVTGDLMDYISDANFRWLEDKFSELDVPYVIVRGNHEKFLKLPEDSKLNILEQDVSITDLGDMQIIGIDNANRKITSSQLSEIKNLLGDKPSIIAMHVPIMTEQNRELLLDYGEYFRMNEYDGCPKENQEFIELISDPKANVVAVLTGHLHFGNISEIGNGLLQYGVSHAITGNAYSITIGE